MKTIKTILVCSVIAILYSCTPSPTLADLNKLNGYWEITGVKTAEGETKNYNFNSNVDFFEVRDESGLRTKVQPQLDGTFIKTNDAEGFSAELLNDKLTLHYSTNFHTWDETILYLDDSKLVTQNESDITYTYRRFTGYLENGKTK